MSWLGDLFQRRIEEVSEAAVIRHFRSPKFTAKITEIAMQHPPFRFVKQMQMRYIERAPGLTMLQAWEHARSNLAAWLADEKVEFGDSRYDWSAEGARTLVDEDMSYWEDA